MRKQKPRPLEAETLVALIEEVERTYYLSEMRGDSRRVDDEAIFDIVGRIERLDRNRSQYLGHRIEISLVCARSFSEEASSRAKGKPFLLSVQLRKSGCSLVAYLPADAFWALPAMISSGAVTHIEARFDRLSYGSGDLQSLFRDGFQAARSRMTAPKRALA